MDTDSPYLNSPFMNPQHVFNQRSLGQLPIITSFIPSLPPQSPFRVSIHSWEKPCPSRILETVVRPDDCILYEVRIYADNVCIAGGLFSARSALPHVIEMGSQVDKNGNQEMLRFPTFHPEVIDQYAWDAADTYGRVRIILSEGFARPNRSPPFERVKDTIVFSFQHAPLSVLENCGIAWPNSNMWLQLPTNLFRYQLNYGGHADQRSYGSYDDHKDLGDLHAHSPTRHDTTRYEGIRAPGNEGNHQELCQHMPQWSTHKSFAPASAPPPLAIPWSDIYRDRRLNLHPSNFGNMFNNGYGGSDPFFDPPMVHRNHQTRHSIGDISMPDAGPLSVSSRAMSSVNGMSYDHSQPASMAASGENVHQANEPTGPAKALHTLSNQQNPAPSMPPVSRPSAAAQARSESYSKATSKATHPDSKDSRQISGSSIKSKSSQTGSVGETVTTRRLAVSPQGQVKGKKEGKAPQKSNQIDSEPPSEPSSREVSREVSVSSAHQPNFIVHTTETVRVSGGEVKRKRHTKAPDEASQTSESPTKKIQRTERTPSLTETDGGIE
ncbi:hypothetical protein BGW36DRAFT_45731 [Talaromyces proteolyticus]|uniref:Uncharacterized protein n=1 Tax=Talaromyces proteolyticus TaxID=1131652 RepID=A0AAD4PXB4_9EURO|nr:uncharacterized protein BGW36DRAFT_45731 [Talaromyces proteolyticus]KAH8692414.1 hypothetical protein BGW36DRAFT_45731 [Talaromyces proteolyticus]